MSRREENLRLAFDRKEISNLLVEVHRRCCICHRFTGVKMEADHIEPKAKGGSDHIDNAILVCFDCHAEIHSYNDQHPRGLKFQPEELRAHKMHWLKNCREHPESFLSALRVADVGPLQALIDELEFNLAVCDNSSGPGTQRGALFADEQFRRAIAHGSISMLVSPIKTSILGAYAAMSCANQAVTAEVNQDPRGRAFGTGRDEVIKSLTASQPKIDSAHSLLLKFLSSERDEATF